MQHSFDTLTMSGQVRRIRSLAQEALVAFGLPRATPLAFIHHGENTTYRVTPSGTRDTYVLRVHRPDHHSPAQIRSECRWLGALAQDTGLVIPEPRAGTDGAVVQQVTHPRVPGVRSCTLLRWVKGRFSLRRGSGAPHRRVGRLTAALHNHAETWKRPLGFRRCRWDAEGLLGRRATFGDPIDGLKLTKTRRARYARTRDRILLKLDAHGTGRRRYGLIHADLHAGNVVVHGNYAAPIDFDDCGVGWHMYDMAVTLVPSRMHPGFTEARAAYVDGYRALRALGDDDVEMFHTFALVRRLVMNPWIWSRRDNPNIGKHLPAALRQSDAMCAAYLKTGRLPTG